LHNITFSAAIPVKTCCAAFPYIYLTHLYIMFGFLNKAVIKIKDLQFRLQYNSRNPATWQKLHGIELNTGHPLVPRAVCEYIFKGIYEIDEHQMIAETLTEDDTVLELGSGIGYNSIHCARISRNKVTTFEANPALIPLIRLHMERNNVVLDVRNEILVSSGNSGADITFNIAEEFWYSSVKPEPGSVITGHVNVPSVSIDDVIREVEPTYLLVDIEGGEEEFFQNCDFLDRSPIKKILMELHPWTIGDEKCNAIIATILSKGFRLRMDLSPKHVVYFYK
jgi:FkbM family methyltransferase